MGPVKLCNNIYAYLTNGLTMMSNAGIIEGANCALMFDTFISPSLTQTFLDFYKTQSDAPINYLVLSHAHGDHCYGAHVPNAQTMIAHASIKPYLDIFSKRDINVEQARFPQIDMKGGHITYPDLYLNDGATIDLGTCTVQLLHYGVCHTNHDLVAYIPEEKVAFCGDVLFNGICPVCNLSDLDNYLDGLRALRDLNAEVYVPGHGAIGGVELVDCMIDYVSLLRGAVEKMCGGFSEEESIDIPALRYYLQNWEETYRFFESLEAQVARRSGGTFNTSYDPERTKRLQEKADFYIR